MYHTNMNNGVRATHCVGRTQDSIWGPGSYMYPMDTTQKLCGWVGGWVGWRRRSRWIDNNLNCNFTVVEIKGNILHVHGVGFVLLQ